MDVTRYEMIVRAKQPIAHAQETIGNQSVLMRKRVRLPGGVYVQVPHVTGDTGRNKIRTAAALGTLHEAELLSDPQLSEGALRLLFAGGMMTGKGDAAVINIDRYRELVALFPPLALFGGCTDNRPVPGQVHVDDLNLICTEMRHLTPPWVLEWMERNGEKLDSCRASVEEVQRVRMDPVLKPEMHKLLNDTARANVQARQLTAEAAHETADSKLKAESKSAMLPRTHERIVQGSLFWFGIEARTYTDIEFDAFSFAVACLLNNFRVGGKQGTGHGLLEFVAGARIAFAPGAGKLENVGSELAPKTGELYRAHVRARKDELKAWLTSAINS